MIHLILALFLSSTSQADFTETPIGTVRFETADTSLTPESETVLRSIADTLLNNLNLMVNVNGRAGKNRLSSDGVISAQMLADKVKDYLVFDLHIASERIHISTAESKEKPGTTWVDIAIRQPDALLTWFENDVKVQPPNLRPDWLVPHQNYHLYHGYRVATGKNSRAYILYPNYGTLKIDEDAMVIIQESRLRQKKFSFLEDIELQNGGLEDMLEDVVRQDDSIARQAALTEKNAEDKKTSIDEKMTDLLVAYESKNKQPNASAFSSQDSTQSMPKKQEQNIKARTDRGLGVIIGEPTGLSFKKWIAGNRAIDFEMGRSITGNRIHIAADYLIHFPQWLKTAHFQPYLGIGARAKFSSETEEARFRFGARVGGGIEYIHGMFGIYGELFPVFDILPEPRFALEGGIGARYYFKD